MKKPKTIFPPERKGQVTTDQPGTSTIQALRQTIHEGDIAYARGQFTLYDAPGQLASDLTAKLLPDHDN